MRQKHVATYTTRGKWEVRLRHAGKRHYLGRFAEERDAIDAVRAAREEHSVERDAELRAQRASGQCTD